MLGAVLIPLRRHCFEYRRIRTSQPGRQKVYPWRSQQPGAGVGRRRGRALFIARGAGPHVWDADGNRYVDYVGSWGPLILGHAHRGVLADIVEAAGNGTSFGAPTECENALARRVVEAFPSMDMVRFVSSGTEAAMSALRLARAYTGRDKIIKFQGGYHGHADALLVAAGSGAMAHGVPDSAGVTASFAQDTLIAEYNDLASVEEHVRAYPGQIACVIVEPVAGNMGVVPPAPGFLQGFEAADGGVRSPPRLRRGHNGVPRCLRRRPAHVRRLPGPDLPG